MRGDFKRLASCEGKAAFETHALAIKVQRRRERPGDRRRARIGQEVYRCEFCRKFHIGQKPRRVDRYVVRDLRLREAEEMADAD